LFGRGALRLGGGQILSASALGTHFDRRDPGPVPRAWLIEKPRAALFPRDGQQVDRLLAGLRLAGPVRGPWQHSTRVYIRAHDDDLTRSLAASLAAIEERREKLAERSAGADLEATGRLVGERQTLQLGLETERGALDDTDFEENRTDVAAAARMRRVKLAPYLQSVTQLPGRLQLSLGARYDWFRLRFDQTAGGDSTSRRSLQRFSPRAGLNWRWSRGNVFAAGSGVFKIPTLDQLYDLRRPFGRPVPLSNPRLEPQHGTSFEVGARLQPDARTSAELVLYRIGMRDEVSFDAASFVYKNVGRSDHKGLELSLQRQWGTRLSTSASYTWTDAFFRSGDVNGNRINGIPAHRGVVGLDLGLPLDVGAALVFEANGSQQLDEANTRELRGYAVTNLRLRRPFGPANAFLQVDNLFDQRHAGSGYVLPFDGAEVLYPATALRAVAGIELQR
jgi:outer membrane receptor protein involved in Fe transport